MYFFLSVVEKMADWVRDKTKWHKMFDFRPKPETSKRNGRLQQEVRGQSSHGYQQGKLVKHNGNGMSSQNSRGQGQAFVKGQRRGENGLCVLSYSSNTEETGRQQRSGDPTIYGYGRETPPDDRIQGQLNVMQVNMYQRNNNKINLENPTGKVELNLKIWRSVMVHLIPQTVSK